MLNNSLIDSKVYNTPVSYREVLSVTVVPLLSVESGIGRVESLWLAVWL